jgi:hypothetical protein
MLVKRPSTANRRHSLATTRHDEASDGRQQEYEPEVTGL